MAVVGNQKNQDSTTRYSSLWLLRGVVRHYRRYWVQFGQQLNEIELILALDYTGLIIAIVGVVLILLVCAGVGIALYVRYCNDLQSVYLVNQTKD